MGSLKLRGETEGNAPKWKKPGRGGRSIASVSFRQLPSASADVRGHPRHVWAEDGICEIMRKNRENCHK